MAMKLLIRWIPVLFLLGSVFSGCGSEENGGSGEAVILAGGPVRNASELTGAWVRTTEGSFAGLEFTEDGQVLAQRSAGAGRPQGTTVYRYSLLEGGRLSLIDAANRATVFSTIREGERLEIQPEARVGTDLQPTVQQFRKLGRGQTIVAALQEEAEKREAALEARLTALIPLLEADDLVLVRTDSEGPEAVIAVRFDHWQPQIAGRALADENPAKDDILRPVSIHPLTGRIEPLDSVSDRIKIFLAIQGATSPQADANYTGHAEFIVDGPIREVTSLKGSLVLTKAWLGTADYELRQDSKRHQAVVAHHQSQSDARQAARQVVADRLGGRIQLSGHKTTSGRQNNPEAVALFLERQEDPNNLHTYAGRVRIGNVEQPVTGVIDLLLGEGALYLNFQRGEQWRLGLAENDRQLTGVWRPHQRTDFISHGDVALTIDSMISMEKLATERAAMTAFLTTGLRTPVQFSGFALDRKSASGGSRWPIFVELMKREDGTANAQVWFLADGIGVTLDCHPHNASFNFQGNTTLEGSAPIGVGVFGRHALEIELTGIDPDPRFEGRVVSGMNSAETMVLLPVKSALSASNRARLIDALSDKTYVLRKTDTSRPEEENTFLTLHTDPSGTTITGELLGDGRGLWRPDYPPGLVSGKIVEDRGHVLLHLVLDSCPHPTLRGGRESQRTQAVIAVDLTGETVTFQGWTVPERGNRDWFTLLPLSAEHTVTATLEQHVQMEAQRIGAVVTVPRSPAPGDEVLLLIHATERDLRGRIYTDGKHYSHGNPISTAALHAGLLQPGETCIVRVRYGEPFRAPVEAIEQNGVTPSRGNFRANNTVPSFALERLSL